jgi:hypothetical protein
MCSVSSISSRDLSAFTSESANSGHASQRSSSLRVPGLSLSQGVWFPLKSCGRAGNRGTVTSSAGRALQGHAHACVSLFQSPHFGCDCPHAPPQPPTSTTTTPQNRTQEPALLLHVGLRRRILRLNFRVDSVYYIRRSRGRKRM